MRLKIALKTLSLHTKSTKAMDIQSEKLNFIQWFSGVTDLTTIQEFIAMKKEKEQDWWDMVSGEEKAEIEEGLAQADRGEVRAHNEVMDKYKKWL
jgi:hypothetical protein